MMMPRPTRDRPIHEAAAARNPIPDPDLEVEVVRNKAMAIAANQSLQLVHF